ncbi:protein of unknown function (plasmid) [Cupriavidus neocaledonicus]|uniref:Uncharacterized protein n=1 Tax=Cupriavidus neocaledonicus TaxID=1040979 RepID=A0A375HMH1_9BURK|nr:protein of unknown function [Cupriavidus neocaledonicus]
MSVPHRASSKLPSPASGRGEKTSGFAKHADAANHKNQPPPSCPSPPISTASPLLP